MNKKGELNILGVAIVFIITFIIGGLLEWLHLQYFLEDFSYVD
jgi:uncharacterized membrane protein YdbT with pleckstrin-like domain